MFLDSCISVHYCYWSPRASWGIWGEGICRLAFCIWTTLDDVGSFLQASLSSTRNPMLVWREQTPSFNLSRELLLVLCSPKLQDSRPYQSINQSTLEHVDSIAAGPCSLSKHMYAC
jgi:hypothetical protein